MPARHVRVDAREGAHRLDNTLLGLGTARLVADGVAQLTGLLEVHPIPNHRPADLGSRAVTVEPEPAVAAAAEAGAESVRVKLPLVARPTRLDHDQPRREPSVLHRIRIRQYVHRLDRIVRERHSRDARRWIDHRGRTQLDAALPRPSAFDAHAARDGYNRREHADGALKTLTGHELVELAAGDRFDGRQRLAARNRGRLADDV